MFLGTDLDTTSSQNDGKRQIRCARPLHFSFLARPSFKNDGNGRAEAVSGWITKRANS